MQEIVDGAVVQIVVSINNEQALQFIMFPLSDESTQTIQVGNPTGVELLIGFLLLMCGSKLVRPAERRVIEGVLRRIDEQIAGDEGDVPFSFRPSIN